MSFILPEIMETLIKSRLGNKIIFLFWPVNKTLCIYGSPRTKILGTENSE